MSNFTHGMSKTPTYKNWGGMIQRCTNPKDPSYPMYGGAGITVCDRWRSFEGFFADMGVRPQGKSIDRIDGKLGYYTENCRWATPREQQNNVSTNRHLEYMGQIKTVSLWADEVGIAACTIIQRLRSGWSAVDALTKPVQKQRGKNDA